jgi:protein phosphatase
MSTTPLTLDEGMLSHRGRVRTLNEDAYGSFRTIADAAQVVSPATLARKGRLYVVADGMGGHEGGEIASATTVQQVCLSYYDNPSDDPATGLRHAIAQANTAVHAAAQARRGSSDKPMGTTVVCAVISGATLTLAHIGDSRAYRLRGAELAQLTEDHDWVTDQMRRNGWSRAEAEDQARRRGARGALLRALGIQETVDVEVQTFDWHAGDTLLLCSDGLHGLVGAEAIAQVLRTAPPALAARELIAAANAAGGHDNITALVVSGTRPRLVLLHPWIQRSALLAGAAALLTLGLIAPVATGQPDGGGGIAAVREVIGLPPLLPTVDLLPTFTPTPSPTSTPTPSPTATMLPPTRTPTRIPATVRLRPTSRRASTVPPPSPAPSPTSSGGLCCSPVPTEPPAVAPTEPPAVAPTEPPAVPPTEPPTPDTRDQGRPEKPTSAPTPAPPPQDPPTQAPAPTQEPPTQAPAPTQEPPTQAPAPTQEPPTQAPAPTQEPPTQAPAPTQEPPTQAPAPTQEPPTQAPAPTQAPPANP